MLDKFWEGIGTSIAGKWSDYIFGPAFLFWIGGLSLYIWKTGWMTVWGELRNLDLALQAIIVTTALLILILSSMIMQVIQFPVLRLLEGYWPWPFNYIGRLITFIRKKFFVAKYDNLRKLKSAEIQGTLSDKDKTVLVDLEIWAHYNPVNPSDLLPTTLGNILRSRERAPINKYGLDAIICWPRMWWLLPDNVRDDLSTARHNLNHTIELWCWGALFLIWGILDPWIILLAIFWLFLTYSMATQSATVYADLVDSAFDLYRLSIYDSLGWPRPQNSDNEKSYGARLTEFLWRGTIGSPSIIYQVKKES